MGRAMGRVSRRTAIGLGLSVVSACASGSADTGPGHSQTPYVLPGATTLYFTSEINGIAYAVYLRAPAPNSGAGGPFPLVLTLDADYQFAIAANHLEHLADRGQVPPVLLAAVGYAGQYPSRQLYQINRTRDYTPVFWPEGHYSSEAQAVSGGGPAFVRVIHEEVIPLIATLHPVSSSDKTFVGHSFGGLFGAWLLSTQPGRFNRYLLISPSLWYAGGMVLSLARSEDFPSMPGATRLYLGVGSHEEQPSGNRRMVSEAREFCDRLGARQDPVLDHELRVFEDENHASIFPAAFSTGIRHLFS